MAFRGDRVRERRDALGISQVELAAILETSQSIIYRYEAKSHTPNGETLSKLADALQCSIDYLMGRVDQPNATSGLSGLEREVFNAIQSKDLPALIELLNQVAKSTHGTR